MIPFFFLPLYPLFLPGSLAFLYFLYFFLEFFFLIIILYLSSSFTITLPLSSFISCYISYWRNHINSPIINHSHLFFFFFYATFLLVPSTLLNFMTYFSFIIILAEDCVMVIIIGNCIRNLSSDPGQYCFIF